MLSAGRARFSGKVRARCRNRNAGRTNQSKCGFMLRHTHRNGGEPRRDLRRDNVAFEIDHGERTRPECIRKLPRLVRNMFPKLFEVAFFCNMKNERVVSGASLCSKIFSTAQPSSPFAPSPYTVSVGNATSPPARMIRPHTFVPFSFCVAALKNSVFMLPNSVPGSPHRPQTGA